MSMVGLSVWFPSYLSDRVQAMSMVGLSVRFPSYLSDRVQAVSATGRGFHKTSLVGSSGSRTQGYFIR